MRQFTELQKKHEEYSKKLNSSIAVLNDYIIATQSTLLIEVATNAKINLGAYDSEGETYEFVAQDTANRRSPFYFNGKVGVPLNTAKSLDRNAPGFITSLLFINFPFNTDSANVNLAMSGLQISMNGQNLKVSGSFSEIEPYKSMENYKVWKPRADSLLSGKLKSQGLDYAYVMNAAVAKDAAAAASESSSSGSGLSWRGWTRILTFTAAAACGAAAALKHREVKDSENEAKRINELNGTSSYEEYKKQYDENKTNYEEKKLHRNIFGGSAGVFAVVGILTFTF